jgi:hypothetical protein
MAPGILPHDGGAPGGYALLMTSETTSSSGTLAEVREFFSRTEAPWRVTIVIIATFIGVLIVAWDTARMAPARPASSSPPPTAPAAP